MESDVRELVLRILCLRDACVGELERRRIAEWDSLKHMEIVFALEDHYGVRFHPSEFALLTTPAAIASALRKHLAA
jgi:acyl carrier protein